MTDMLRMDYINSLPQPLFVSQYGSRDWWWPVHDIEVQTGLLRIDVCGKLQVLRFGEIAAVRDAGGCEYNPDAFYKE
jgi:hypothetical protein